MRRSPRSGSACSVVVPYKTVSAVGLFFHSQFSIFLLLQFFRGETDIGSLPKLKGTDKVFSSSEDALAPQRRALLWKKLLLCGIRFDFQHSGEEAARDMKRNTLLELMDASESMG